MKEGKSWAPLLGILFSVLIILFSQGFGICALFLSRFIFPNIHKFYGLWITNFLLASSLFGIFLVIFLIYLSKIKINIYLSLHKFKFKSFLFWFFIFGIFISTSEYFLYKKGLATIPDFLIKAYNQTPHPLLLFFAIIFVTPLFEEILFRGFLFKSIEDSRLGGKGAVLIPAFLWSLLHLQYNFYEIFVIFIAGIIFGLSRIKTKSIFLPLTLHFLQNLSSSIFFYITYG